MKKLFLILVFAFATVSIGNANTPSNEIKSQVQDRYEECHELYNKVRDAVMQVTGDFHLAVTIAIRAEEDCTDDIDRLY